MEEEYVKKDEFYELKKIVEELAKSHQELAKSHQELAKSHQQLAKEHEKTEKVVRELARSVGKITDTIGFGLEILALSFLPSYVKSELSIHARNFERRFFEVNGKEVEINLFATGRKNGTKIALLVECKSSIYKQDVRKFLKKIEMINHILPKSYFAFIVSYFVHPSAFKLAKEKGVKIISQIPHGI